MRHLLLFLCFLCLAAATPTLVKAAEQNQITDSQVDYSFGGSVTFQAMLPPDQPVDKVEVFMQSEGETETIVGEANLQDGRLSYILDLSEHPLRPFSEVTYWYRVSPQAGEPYNTPPSTFFYGDNRYIWQELESPPFRVHWYDGDASFGQHVLDTAQAGLDKIQGIFPSDSPLEPIDIYVYASGLEMQSTLRLAGLNWVAGHADPELRVIMVSLPPGPDQRLETERKLPHELMHILMYQLTGPVYFSLPVWFREGMASIAEIKPNPDYYIILNSAVEKDELLPIALLCNNFPSDASLVYLAYAESASFSSYLQYQYGNSGLQALLKNYADGFGCERGPELALGASLTRLDGDWRQAVFGERAILTALENLAPWLFIFGIVLAVPLALTLGSLRRGRRSARTTQTESG